MIRLLVAESNEGTVNVQLLLAILGFTNLAMAEMINEILVAKFVLT